MSARAALAESLAPRMGREVGDLQVRAIAAACAGALAVAVEYWTESGGNLGEHVDLALAALE